MKGNASRNPSYHGRGVLHGSQVCIRQREHFLTPNRGKAELIGWGPRSAVFLPDAFSHMGGSAFGATAHAAVHDAFMTLPPYTSTTVTLKSSRRGEGNFLDLQSPLDARPSPIPFPLTIVIEHL